MSEAKAAARFLALRVHPLDLFSACGAIFAAATIFGFLGQFWWFFDLFSHFRVQLVIGLGTVALVALFRRNYLASAFLSVFAGVNLCTIVPLYFGDRSETGAVFSRHKALLLNVNSETGDPAKVAQLIEQEQPDIVALEEINDKWLAAVNVPLTNYPYFKTVPRDDNFGIALFCKYRLTKCEERQIGEAELPSIIAEIQLGRAHLTVITTHPLPPWGAENSQLRNEQLAQLPAMVKQSNSPVLLLGDLNATPWSASFRQLIEESHLTGAFQGRGVLPTWPTYLPIFLIPIDHCLHSSGVHITRLARGPRVGSDHYPLLVDFVVDLPGGN